MKAGLQEKFVTLKLSASRREHGTRARYVSGCKCMICRAANSRYQCERDRARREEGDTRELVPASMAVAHLRKLSNAGVGYKAVAEAAGLAPSTLGAILFGQRKQIRANHERAILGVTQAAVADGALIDAGPTWRRIKALLKRGYTKSSLARIFGYKSPSLQIKAKRIRAMTAWRLNLLCDAIEAGTLRRAD